MEFAIKCLDASWNSYKLWSCFRTGSSVASSSKMISFNYIWDPSGLKENSLGEIVGDWAENTEIGSLGTDYLA